MKEAYSKPVVDVKEFQLSNGLPGCGPAMVGGEAG